MSVYDRSYFYPLYLYPQPEKEHLFDAEEPSEAPGGRRPNLAPEFIEDFSKRLRLKFLPDGKGDLQNTFGPEDVFDYLYALFHSPTYRQRYAEFLKIDFPRLPLTSRPALFRALCALGERLVALHLMEKHGPEMASYPVDGDSLVEKVRYEEKSGDSPRASSSLGTVPDFSAGRVWINKTQFFDGVPEEVWNFHVGGYQVCHKWLKDRKGRRLSYDDITHYQRIVAALAETLRLMSEIDATIQAHGGWPVG